MNEINPKEPPRMHEERGSEVKRFMASRGTLLMKEFREVNVVKCDHYFSITISSAILSFLETSSSPNRVVFGVRLEMYEGSDHRASAFLDFEELEEIVAALDYINELAKGMAGQERDYTEVNYISKDDVTFGFFQSHQKQVAYMSLDGYGDQAYMSLFTLDFVKKNLIFARDFFISRGAKL